MRRRVDVLWVSAALGARLVPLSAIPVLVRCSSPGDADWFALVQADASVLAVILGFSNAALIQSADCDERAGRIALLSVVVTSVLSAGLLLVPMQFDRLEDRWAFSVLLGACLSLFPGAQAMARRSGRLGKAAMIDALRSASFLAGLVVLAVAGPVSPSLMALLLGAYYALPVLFWLPVGTIRSEFGLGYREFRIGFRRMAILTASSLASVYAWMHIRYALSANSSTGELSAFTATLSVASVMALFGDLVIFRFGQRVLESARDRDPMGLRCVARRCGLAVVVLASLSSLLVAAYVFWQFPSNCWWFLAVGLLLVVGFVIRLCYTFVQQVLLGLARSEADFIGAILMLLFSLATAGALSARLDAVGASIAFVGVATTFLAAVSFGALRSWRCP
jgi:O-antigen/teichoic acid export membrane protein